MATNTEAPNTLLCDQTLNVLDLLCAGPISGFTYKGRAFTGDPLLSTYYNDVPIRNLDGSYNYNVSGAGFNFQYMLGTSTQTGIPGFQKVESVIPLGANTLVSNPLPGAGPYKTVVAAFNTQMYPDADSVKVTMRVPALFSQDDNGNTNGYNVGYAIDVCVNDGTFNTLVTDSFNGKCTTPYLRDHIVTLPKTSPASTYYSWKVRVRRTTTDIQSIRTQNAIYVDSMSLISSSLYAYPNSVMVGTEISANQFSEIPARAYEVYGMLVNVPNGYTPTQYNVTGSSFNRQCDIAISNKLIGVTTQSLDQMYGITVGSPVTGVGIPANTVITSVHNQGPDYFFAVDKDPTATNNNIPVTFFPLSATLSGTYPTVWTGDFAPSKVWTDNPAWVFYDLLTDPVHGLGDYIASGSVDKWTLYQLAQYCDQMVDDGAGGLEPRFTCNVAIQQPEQAYSVLLNLASTFRGMLYYANGTIHPVSTNDLQSPVYAFNNANVINGTFSYSDTANETRSTVAMVKYTDPNNGWRDNVAYVEDQDGILRYGYNEKQMTAFACTSAGQAYRLGSWTLETERLLTETVTFQTSMEGLYLMPGDVFAVYDNFRNNRSQAGRVMARSTGGSQITLDRPIALDAGITYSLTCIVPEYVLDSGSITGSDQIPLLRNPQIQSFRVTDGATSSIQQLTVAGQFSSGLYVGSPWILSASGNTGIFNKASFYTCLATSEIEPGKIEVLGLQASTGITFTISTGYTVIDQPPNNGNSSSVQAPTNFIATWVTGALADNTFFSNIALSWTDSQSINASYYAWSGQTPGFSYSGYKSVGPNSVFPVTAPGTYNFKVATVSDGGVYSSYATTTYVIPNSNPFGVSPPLSGVFIFKNADDLYADPASHALTGYIGTQPGLEWNFQQDPSRQTDVPAFDLITGYRIRISGFDGTSNYLTPPIVIEGNQNSSYVFPDRFLYTGLGGYARRGFDFWVDTLDQYGGIATGGHIRMNNEPPRAPLSSGFVGYNGGIYYQVTPAINNDLSGIWIWYNTSPSFTPTYQNANYVSDNMAGLVTNGIYQLSNYYMWYALTDTFGYTGCPIYGPISIDPNGSFTGTTLVLNQRIDSVTASMTGASGVLSAQVATVSTALATTGSALAQWMTYLSATTTGATASVAILASAMVTGATNGTGGVPVASWGFKLDANGKVVSMRATTNNAYGQPSDIGTIAFSGANLQSESFVRGSKGWIISPSGDAEFNNVIVRGAFTGGSTNYASINSFGFTVGTNGANDRIEIPSAATNSKFLDVYNGNNVLIQRLGSLNLGGAYIGAHYLYDEFGVTPGITMNGRGAITATGLTTTNTLSVTSTSTLGGAATFSSTSTFNGSPTFNANINSNYDIYLGTTSQERWLYLPNGGRIQWGSAGSYDMYVYRFGSKDWRINVDGSDRFVVKDTRVTCLVPLKIDNAKTTIGTETVTHYVTIQDGDSNTIKLAVLT